MLRENHRPGIEPATCKSQVQRLAAEQPRNMFKVGPNAHCNLLNEKIEMSSEVQFSYFHTADSVTQCSKSRERRNSGVLT